MADEGVTPDGPALDGLPLDAAVAAVVERTGDDPETVEVALREVAAAGVVSHDAAESALAHAAKVVATPETRVEHAAMRIEETRETAAAVAHLDPVDTRLEGFGDRLAAVESRVADLGVDLRSLVDRTGDPGTLYEVATGVRRLEAAADATQAAADELAVAAEEFEAWVRNPDRRLDDLDSETEAVASSLDDLAAGVAGSADVASPALRHRVVRLLLADLQAEVDALRAWPAPDPDDAHGAVAPDRLADLTARLDGLDRRCRAAGDRLDPPDDDRLDILDDLEPPVDWRRVESVLDGDCPA
jgi:hypothetical protein